MEGFQVKNSWKKEFERIHLNLYLLLCDQTSATGDMSGEFAKIHGEFSDLYDRMTAAGIPATHIATCRKVVETTICDFYSESSPVRASQPESERSAVKWLCQYLQLEPRDPVPMFA